MTLEELRARLEALRTEILTLAEADELTDEQEARYTEANTEFDEARAAIEAAETRAARIEEVRSAAVSQPGARQPGVSHEVPNLNTRSEDPFDLSEVRTFGRSRHQVGAELRSRTMDAIEADRAMSDDAKENATRLVQRCDTRSGDLSLHVLTTGNEDYRSAFAKLVTDPNASLTAEESRAVEAVRAMSIGTDNQGGYLMPYNLDPTIILTGDGSINPLRQLARQRSVVGDNWHGATSAGVTAGYGAENSEVGDNSPTIGDASIAVHKAHAFVPFSIEAEQDLAGLQEDVATMFNEAKDDLEAVKFVLGSGVAEPTGVITAVAAVASSRVTTATADTFVVGDVYSLQSALAPRHRSRAAWLAALAIINLMRQFGTANNYHGFLTDLTGSTPRQLLGQRLEEVSSMDDSIDAAADNDILLYGDFGKYLIVDRIGMSVELVPHLFGANGRPTGQRGWYAHWRNGAGVLDANAFRLLRA